MGNILSDLYNISIACITLCVVSAMVTGYYLVKIIKFDKKEKLLNQELAKIKIMKEINKSKI